MHLNDISLAKIVTMTPKVILLTLHPFTSISDKLICKFEWSNWTLITNVQSM